MIYSISRTHIGHCTLCNLNCLMYILTNKDVKKARERKCAEEHDDIQTKNVFLICAQNLSEKKRYSTVRYTKFELMVKL